MIEPTRPLMVLQEHDDRRLVFRFQSSRWALITLLVGAVFGVFAYIVASSSGMTWGTVVLALCVLFLYSSLYSFTAHQSLDIYRDTQQVTLVERNLYRHVNRTMPFTDFREVSIFRGSITGQRGTNWHITLVKKDDDAFHLGLGEFGALTHDAARQLAARIADLMEIPISDPGPG